MKKIKMHNLYKISSILILIMGLIFTYFVADSEDAPGFIFLGTPVTIFLSLFLFELGNLIKYIELQNQLLLDIYKEIKNKMK